MGANFSPTDGGNDYTSGGPCSVFASFDAVPPYNPSPFMSHPQPPSPPSAACPSYHSLTSKLTSDSPLSSVTFPGTAHPRATVPSPHFSYTTGNSAVAAAVAAAAAASVGGVYSPASTYCMETHNSLSNNLISPSVTGNNSFPDFNTDSGVTPRSLFDIGLGADSSPGVSSLHLSFESNNSSNCLTSTNKLLLEGYNNQSSGGGISSSRLQNNNNTDSSSNNKEAFTSESLLSSNNCADDRLNTLDMLNKYPVISNNRETSCHNEKLDQQKPEKFTSVSSCSFTAIIESGEESSGNNNGNQTTPDSSNSSSTEKDNSVTTNCTDSPLEKTFLNSDCKATEGSILENSFNVDLKNPENFNHKPLTSDDKQLNKKNATNKVDINNDIIKKCSNNDVGNKNDDSNCLESSENIISPCNKVSTSSNNDTKPLQNSQSSGSTNENLVDIVKKSMIETVSA